MTDALRGRLARWSQRKAAARRGDTPPLEGEDAAKHDALPDDQCPSDSTVKAGGAGDSTPAISEEGVPDLPSIEELTFQSDYTAFMAKNVPEALRRAALRKLWQSDPVLANLDGLNDYDEDYHLVDTTITAAQTAYKVGKGYLEEVVSQLDETKEPEVADALESQPESGEQKQAIASVLRDDETPKEESEAGPERDTAEDEPKILGGQKGSV